MEERDSINISTDSQINENNPDTEGKDIRRCYTTCKSGCYKLDTHDWLEDVSDIDLFNDVIEVRFKNTRKAYFLNQNNLRLKKGDVVAVEASPGHDIGVVDLTGQIVKHKLISEGIDYKKQEFKRVYRKAKSVDIDKWKAAVDLEHPTMIRSRQISTDLGLNMKIGDVEYQGDKTKAIFYYIADERVDFRQLIKVLAEEFKVRIEMRQIGARQEAGRIGGIGSCGRELCCASFVKNFVSVTTNAARYQEVSLNPQKLAGQCGKLKCCLNYELDTYLDAQQDFPDTSLQLKTKKGFAIHQKTDVFKRMMWYLYKENDKDSITCMTVDTVKEVIAMNKKGKYPDHLKGVEESAMSTVVDYQNSVGLESLTRFEDKPEKPSKQKSRNKNRNRKGSGSGSGQSSNRNMSGGNKDGNTGGKKPYRKDRRRSGGGKSNNPNRNERKPRNNEN